MLHSYFRSLRRQRSQSGWTPLYEMSVGEARQADLEEIQLAAGRPEAVHAVVPIEIPTRDGMVKARIYRPSIDRGLPVLAYFFGGGWTLGSLDTCDAICRHLANRGGFAVASVAYRLAPENKFPAAVQDCYDAVLWLSRYGDHLDLDGRRLAVAGDSAGGNLAAAVALMARDLATPPLSFQLLFYPVLEYMAATESMMGFTDRYLFNRYSMEWYWNHYLDTPEDASNPYAAPLRAGELGGVAPALVITAGYDPLRDEGHRFAEQLRAAGVKAQSICYDGMAHGFVAMLGELEQAREALDVAAERTRAALWLRDA